MWQDCVLGSTSSKGRLLDDVIERDARSDGRSKLAGLVAEALADHKSGRSRRL
jgi:hypothetical protein